MAGAIKLASYTVVQSKLRKYVKELEEIALERADLRTRARNVRKRAADDGFDLPALAETLRLTAHSDERRKIIDLYLIALGAGLGGH